jgi:hypothetical protein
MPHNAIRPAQELAVQHGIRMPVDEEIPFHSARQTLKLRLSGFAITKPKDALIFALSCREGEYLMDILAQHSVVACCMLMIFLFIAVFSTNKSSQQGRPNCPRPGNSIIAMNNNR